MSASDPKRKLGLVLFGAYGGTDVFLECEGLPRGVPTSDNENGTQTALAKFAALVEAG